MLSLDSADTLFFGGFMRFSPEQKNTKLLTAVIIVILVLSVISYSIPSALAVEGVTVPPIIFVGMGLIGFIASIFLFLRYGMTKFEYVLKPRDDAYPGEAVEFSSDAAGNAPLDFVVYKAMGTRHSSMECVLPIGDLIEAIPLKRGERSKKDVARAYSKENFTFYDYTLTFMPDETLELVFADGNKSVGIIIENDNPVADYFTSL